MLNFITYDGDRRKLIAQTGQSLMQVAVDQQVHGILGECGGAMACGSCHVYLDGRWHEISGEPDALELGLLESSSNCQRNSRLGCQVVLTEQMDGMDIHLPASQLI